MGSAHEADKLAGDIQAIPNGQPGTCFSGVVFRHLRQGPGYVLCVGESEESAYQYALRQIQQNDTLDSREGSASEALHRSEAVQGLTNWFDQLDPTLALERLLLPHILAVDGIDVSEHGVIGFDASIAALIATRTMDQGRGGSEGSAPDCGHVQGFRHALSKFHHATQDYVMAELLRNEGSDQDHRAAHSMGMKLLTAEVNGEEFKFSPIAAKMHDSLWSFQALQDHWRDICGFTLQELRAFNNALSDYMAELGERIATELDTLPDPVPLPENAAELYDLAARSLVCRGKLFNLRPEDLASSAGLSREVGRRILEFYSYDPPERSLEDELAAIARGENPRFGRKVFRINDTEYLVLPGGTSEADLLRIMGMRAKQCDQNKQHRFRKSLHDAATKLSSEVIERLSGGCVQSQINLEFYAQHEQIDKAANLGRNSTTFKQGKKFEADCLVVVDDVAICVEVKARGVRPQARAGEINALLGDLKGIVSEADVQAARLSQLIHDNSGVWAVGGRWIDLSGVREVHSLIVTTEDLGQVGIATHDMARLGMIGKEQYPWLISLHDLHIVEKVLTEPYQFGTYLRRRTDATTSAYISPERECDLAFWFLRGGLDYLKDPDVLHARFPNSYTPTPYDRWSYEQQPFTIISPFGASLDSLLEAVDQDRLWQGEVRKLPPLLNDVAQFMRRQNRLGWFRAGSSLYGMSPASVLDHHAAIMDTLERGQRKGKCRKNLFGMTDLGGNFAVSVSFVQESILDPDVFRSEVMADKYKNRADRILGVALDASGRVVDCLWIEHPFVQDPVLDALYPPDVRMPLGVRRSTKLDTKPKTPAVAGNRKKSAKSRKKQRRR